jgi:ABC-type Na+ efflux pump permease subunit
MASPDEVSAGQKERGTLKSLLVIPTSDRGVFLGKLPALFLVAAVGTATGIVGFWTATGMALGGAVGAATGAGRAWL